MLIVDVHAHVGYDHVVEREFPREEVLKAHRANGVNKTIVQPGTVFDLAGVREQHDAIAAFAGEHPGEFVGMVCANPHLPEPDYFAEVQRCVRELGFVGVKLLPSAHAVPPGSKAARLVFEAARTLGVPVMVHTGSGVPWSSPSLFIPLAMDYPPVPVVLAHAGMGVFSAEALVAARVCPNVFLETSWVPGSAIRNFVQTVGPQRVMFGGDMPYNAAIELFKHRAIGLTEIELEWVLGGTAIQVYGLPGGEPARSRQA